MEKVMMARTPLVAKKCSRTLSLAADCIFCWKEEEKKAIYISAILVSCLSIKNSHTNWALMDLNQRVSLNPLTIKVFLYMTSLHSSLHSIAKVSLYNRNTWSHKKEWCIWGQRNVRNRESTVLLLTSLEQPDLIFVAFEPSARKHYPLAQDWFWVNCNEKLSNSSLTTHFGTNRFHCANSSELTFCFEIGSKKNRKVDPVLLFSFCLEEDWMLHKKK